MIESMDFGALLQKAQEMQRHMQEALQLQSLKTLKGTTDDERVAVFVDGNGQYKSIRIAPELLMEVDAPELERLVLIALEDAARQVYDLQKSAIGSLDIVDPPNQ